MATKFGIWNAYKDCNLNYPNFGNVTDCIETGLLWVGSVFSIFSIIGSLFIIWTFCVYEDQRTRARLFLLFIAICDFFTAVGYAIALIWSLFNKDFSICVNNKSHVVLSACIIESGIDMYFPVCSFFWTVVLGFHIFFLFIGKAYFKKKVVFVCILVAGWGLPLLNTLVAFFLNVLGPGPPTSNAGWCFINYNIYDNNTKNDKLHWVFEFTFAKMWDLSAMIIVIIMYTIVFIRLCVQKCRSVEKSFSGPDFKLIFIPLVFFILRIWGDSRWLIETIPQDDNFEYSQTCKYPSGKVLAYLQVIGDPGQGWANAILYILLTEAIRKRIFSSFKKYFKRVCCCFVRKSTPSSQENETDMLVNEKANRLSYY
ncbi:hypothetical protein LOD99_11574 [Oopsacas minuta]|uniref:G-protein coupled receptors family 2 profile 2 domain-containing protein n=1 Tax=Oopsacas minuta TaxID=111878 RepID=A0AAV7JKG8_9METZ|nr:hypothetical protein LOD99_11574 [Oopsacas minuta]